jgi:hypothetical protein
MPAGATTAIHVPVGFNLFYDQGNSPQPFIPSLGLTTLPDIDSAGITVDSQDNFVLAVRTSSLYGGGPRVAHINSALTAFLADPTTPTQAIPSGIADQNVDGTNELAFTDPAGATYTAANPANYKIDSVGTKKIKRKVELVAHPLTSFTVAYSPGSSKVTIAFTAKETFPDGGQITVLSGVTGDSGAALAGTTVFTISKGGKRIEPE